MRGREGGKGGKVRGRESRGREGGQSFLQDFREGDPYLPISTGKQLAATVLTFGTLRGGGGVDFERVGRSPPCMNP